nr:MAG TPA: hypothetical protein [Caudoviricetes sp.]
MFSYYTIPKTKKSQNRMNAGFFIFTYFWLYT